MKSIWQALVVCVILVGAVVFALLLRQPVRTSGAEAVSVVSEPVTVVTLKKGAHPILLSGWGQVTAKERYQLLTEVSGVVAEHAQGLHAGQAFEKGALLMQIAPREYELDIEIEQAAVAGAEFELQSELGRQTLARQEWALLQQATDGPNRTDLKINPKLRLREAHVAQKRAALRAAQSRLALAQLERDKTRRVAPCDGVWLGPAVAVGQFLTLGAQFGEFLCTETFQIILHVPLSELTGLRSPPALEPVAVQVAGQAARFVEWVPQLDVETNMLPILLEMDDPLTLSTPVLLNQWVDVQIQLPDVDGVFALPVAALRDDALMWQVDEAQRLQQVPVAVMSRTQQQVLVRPRVPVADVIQVIVNPIQHAHPGLRVRIVDERVGEALETSVFEPPVFEASIFETSADAAVDNSPEASTDVR